MVAVPFPIEERRAPERVPARVERVRSGSQVRAIARLDAGDERAYAIAVARIAPRVEAHLGSAAVANRVRSLEGQSVQLEPLTLVRRRFDEIMGVWRARPPAAVLLADVRSCYASLTPRTVFHRLVLLGCHPAEAGAVTGLLERFEADGVPGLPIGPPPSGVLANAVLAAADGALAACGATHARWVDDFVVPVASVAAARDLLAVLREALGALGLSLAGEKTRLVQEPALIRDALRGTGSSGPPAGCAEGVGVSSAV